jgi:surface protein
VGPGESEPSLFEFPDDMLTRILRLADDPCADLEAFCQVSKHSCLTDDAFWHVVCKDAGWDRDDRTTGDHALAEKSDEVPMPWKHQFMKWCKLRFKSRVDLGVAVRVLLDIRGNRTGEKPHPTYGPIGSWDVSRVTNMDWLFSDAAYFNAPIGLWNVSNVINMNGLFFGCEKFDHPLDGWDVSSVTTMESMFHGAADFNRPLNRWGKRTSNVRNMQGMFSYCKTFNHPLDNWDVSNVQDMSFMFTGCRTFKHPLDNWDVSNVQDMLFMFSGCKTFNQPLNNWDVSNVQDMRSMFSGAATFNQQINNWDVSKVNDMSYMFSRAADFEQSLEGWKVHVGTLVGNMFDGSKVVGDNVPSWYNGSSGIVLPQPPALHSSGLQEQNAFDFTDLETFQ